MTLPEFISTFPQGGGYEWDRPLTPEQKLLKAQNKFFETGVTRDLIYQGNFILHRDSRGTTYCTGFTFQGWFETIGHTLTLSVKDMKNIQQTWYIAIPGKWRGVVDALVPRGLALEVKPQDIKLGDIAQLWRKKKDGTRGSGHSVYPLRIDKDFLTYKSTQDSTNGVGERKEKLSTLFELHICRPL